MLLQRTLLIAALILICAKMIAQTEAEEAVDRAKYDNACADAAATLVTFKNGNDNSDFAKRRFAELPARIKLCNAHPIQSVCQSTVQVLMDVVGKSPLSCGSRE